MRNNCLFWVTLAFVVGCTVAIVIITSRDKPDQSYAATVSINSGMAEVQSLESKARLLKMKQRNLRMRRL